MYVGVTGRTNLKRIRRIFNAMDEKGEFRKGFMRQRKWAPRQHNQKMRNGNCSDFANPVISGIQFSKDVVCDRQILDDLFATNHTVVN